MSADPEARRPLAVTLVVVLTAVVAVLDLVIGVLLLTGVDDIGSVEGMTQDQTTLSAQVVAGVFLLFGVVQAVVAYQLAKGSNGARLVVTVILIAQQLHSLYLGAQLDIQRVPGFAGLAIAVVILLLVWNPVSSRWFDRGRNSALADSIDAEGAEHQPSGTRMLDFLMRLIVLGATIALIAGHHHRLARVADHRGGHGVRRGVAAAAAVHACGAALRLDRRRAARPVRQRHRARAGPLAQPRRRACRARSWRSSPPGSTRSS